jgi:hypothetical protein
MEARAPLPLHPSAQQNLARNLATLPGAKRKIVLQYACKVAFFGGARMQKPTAFYYYFKYLHQRNPRSGLIGSHAVNRLVARLKPAPWRPSRCGHFRRQRSCNTQVFIALLQFENAGISYCVFHVARPDHDASKSSGWIVAVAAGFPCETTRSNCQLVLWSRQLVQALDHLHTRGVPRCRRSSPSGLSRSVPT